MNTRALAIVAACVLCAAAIGAQVPSAPPGAQRPGPAVPRTQRPARDGTAQPATGTGTIQGRVVSADTGAPLRRAQVRIFAAELRVNRIATTDADGRYEIANLPAARYNINVTRNGYVGLQFGQQRPFEPGKPLDLADGQVAAKIDFALPRGGVITGRITDEAGEPLEGVSVRAMRYRYMPEGTRRLMPFNAPGIFNIQTNDLGEFRVFGLMPGTYVLTASANNMGSGMMMAAGMPGPVAMLGPSDGVVGFAPTYYPGTANESDALPITVALGQETSVSFALVPARLSRITGAVRTSQGEPAANVNVSLRSARPGMGFGFGGMTGPDGAFTMMNVPPGEYHLDVRPRPRRMALPGAPEHSEIASVPISVAGEDITNLIVTTGHGGSVSGRVIFENGSQQAVAELLSGPRPLRVMFASSDMNMSMMAAMDNGTVGPDGQFRLRGLIGRGTFRFGAAGWSVKSITLEGVDITDTLYEVSPGANLAGLEIVVTNVQSTVSGTVRTAAGELAKDYVVVFFPAGLREGQTPTRYVRTVRPDQDGKYLLRGLPPTDYFAVAVDSLEQGGEWDPAFQERAKLGARRITIREGQTVAVDLLLQQ